MYIPELQGPKDVYGYSSSHMERVPVRRGSMCSANSLQSTVPQSHCIWCQYKMPLWFPMPLCLQTLSGPQSGSHFEPLLEFTWAIRSHGCPKDCPHLCLPSGYSLSETTVTNKEEYSLNFVFNRRVVPVSCMRHVVVSLSSRADIFWPFWCPRKWNHGAETEENYNALLSVSIHWGNMSVDPTRNNSFLCDFLV